MWIELHLSICQFKIIYVKTKLTFFTGMKDLYQVTMCDRRLALKVKGSVALYHMCYTTFYSITQDQMHKFDPSICMYFNKSFVCAI